MSNKEILFETVFPENYEPTYANGAILSNVGKIHFVIDFYVEVPKCIDYKEKLTNNGMKREDIEFTVERRPVKRIILPLSVVPGFIEQLSTQYRALTNTNPTTKSNQGGMFI